MAAPKVFITVERFGRMEYQPDLLAGLPVLGLVGSTFDDEGRYHTGDIGVLDADGYLTITDRKSDVIIRGGENISAMEVEELILGLDGVEEAAVVAAPDPRLGEHAAAVLRMLAGRPVPSLEQLRAHLERAGLARQKWPRRSTRSTTSRPPRAARCSKYVLRADVAARINLRI